MDVPIGDRRRYQQYHGTGVVARDLRPLAQPRLLRHVFVPAGIFFLSFFPVCIISFLPVYFFSLSFLPASRAALLPRHAVETLAPVEGLLVVLTGIVAGPCPLFLCPLSVCVLSFVLQSFALQSFVPLSFDLCSFDL